MVEYRYINEDWCYNIDTLEVLSTESIDKAKVYGSAYCSPIGRVLTFTIDDSEADVMTESTFCRYIDSIGYLHGVDSKYGVFHSSDLILSYLSDCLLPVLPTQVWRHMHGIAVSTDRGIFKLYPVCSELDKYIKDYTNWVARLKMAGIEPAYSGVYV